MDDVGEGEVEWNGENVGIIGEGVIGFIFLPAVEEVYKEMLLFSGATSGAFTAVFLSYTKSKASEAAPAVIAITKSIISSNLIVTADSQL